MISRSVSHTAEFGINQPPQSVFPLFTPEGEKLWAPGWDYENLLGTTKLHEDYLFLTTTHDHAGSGAIWIVKKYDPDAHCIQYYKIEPGEKVGIIDVRCYESGRRSSRVRVTYTYTGLSEVGNRFVTHFTKKDYDAFIAEWKRWIDAYYARGLRGQIHSSRH
jgi:hypothetical protein